VRLLALLPGTRAVGSAALVHTRSRPSERIVAPVHQRVPPAGVADIAARALGEVPVHVADDLAHVPVVVLVEPLTARAEQTDDATARGVADRLAAAFGLEAHGLRLVGAQPRL